MDPANHVPLPRELHRLRVAVVHREVLLRRQIHQSLDAAGYAVVDLASCAEARDAIEDAPPDVLVVSLDSEDGESLELVEGMARDHGVPAVVIARQAGPALMERLRTARVFGCVVQPFSDAQLRAAVEVALGHAKRNGAVDRKRLDELELTVARMGELLMETGLFWSAKTTVAPSPALVALFSPREKEVLNLLMAHKRTKSIAKMLGISPSTVRNHLKSMFAKAGVKSQEELIERLLEHRSP